MMSTVGSMTEMKDFLINLPGDVWAVDLNREDRWFQRLDWQSQFEISRFTTENLVEECILYASPKHFPHKMTLLVNKKTLEEWTQCLYQKWVQVGRPDLVVFLPQMFRKDQFLQEWQNQEPHISQVHVIEGFNER